MLARRMRAHHLRASRRLFCYASQPAKCFADFSRGVYQGDIQRARDDILMDEVTAYDDDIDKAGL